MTSVDVWFILWGIVIAFFIQVIYDRIGASEDNRKFRGGILFGVILAIVVVLMAYPFVGLYNLMGEKDTILMWVALAALVVATSLWLLSFKIKPQKPKS
jgi:hypothetical protein